VDGRPLCQYVPDSEAYDDYPARMFELLTGVAEVEERPRGGGDRRHLAAGPPRTTEATSK
jgi:hypothetical protein